MEKNLTVCTDGGSRGNPGRSACAFVAKEGEQEIYKQSKFLGIQTNNFAEYSGILLALQWVVNKYQYQINTNIKFQINFNSDSELVIKQLNGLYKIKNPVLKKLNNEIKEIISENHLEIIFQNFPREENTIADVLVNEELDRN
jgi:ribonuclease HI